MQIVSEIPEREASFSPASFHGLMLPNLVTCVCPVYLVDKWQSWCFVPPYGRANGGSVDAQANLKWSLKLEFWSWSKQWEILLVVISKSCLWWFDSYWEGLMLRTLVNDWIHVSSELVLEDGKMACTCLGDFCWEVGSNVKKWGNHCIERRTLL